MPDQPERDKLFGKCSKPSQPGQVSALCRNPNDSVEFLTFGVVIPSSAGKRASNAIPVGIDIDNHLFNLIRLVALGPNSRAFVAYR